MKFSASKGVDATLSDGKYACKGIRRQFILTAIYCLVLDFLENEISKAIHILFSRMHAVKGHLADASIRFFTK
jgi:hypothetical protein